MAPLVIPIASTELDGSLPLLDAVGGVVTGTTRVIYDPNDRTNLSADEILVAPQTDPAWTPLFLGAAGVIVEYGAVMSHAAIVARELGSPAVVGVDQATSELRTGTHVPLDGNTGAIRVHPSSAPVERDRWSPTAI